jgi:hypothetical protein
LSPLTKVFVVLHVVLSMMLTAAVVVFVNRTDDFKKQAADEVVALNQAKNDAGLARAEVIAATSDYQAKLNAKDAAITAQREALAADDTQIGTLNGQLAELTSRSAQMASALDGANEALKVAQQQNATVENNFTALRQSSDALQKENTESSLRITDLQNKLDVTERQRRYLAEQVTQLTSQNAQQAEIIHKNLPAIEDRNNAIINPTPTIALDGVIRDKTVIAGVPYATISLGSADAVEKNMQFKVIDGDRFLGYLTVDTVEPHEATGRLEGPHVDDIKGGVEVKTQL